MGTDPHREGQERGREGGIEWEGELELKKKKEAWGEKENANGDPERERERGVERQKSEKTKCEKGNKI